MSDFSAGSETGDTVAERFRLALWATGSAIWDWNIEQNLFWSSSGNQLLFRRGGDEIAESLDIGDPDDPWGSRLHPGDRERVLQCVRDHLAHETPYDVEYRYRLPDGEYIWVRSVGRAVRDSTGKPLRMVGSNSDITARKRAEQALLESRVSLSGIMDNIADSVVTIDESGTILSCNRATELAFGYDAQEIIGGPVERLMPEPHATHHHQYLNTYLETGRSMILGKGARELEGRRKDGSPVPIELAISEMVVGGRRTFIGAMRDISQRKRSEQALRESENSLRLVTDNIPAMIAYVDRDSHYRFLNKRYEERMGLPIQEMLGKPVREILSPATYSKIGPWMARALAGERVRFEAFNEFPDGTSRYLDIEYVPDLAADGDVQGYFSVVNDITDRKAVEEALAESEARLAEAQEIANVGSWSVFVEQGKQTKSIYSAELCRIYGIAQDAVPQGAEAYAQIVHEEDRDRVNQAWAKSLAEGAPYDVEHRIVRPSGEERFVLSKARSYQDQSSGAVQWIGATSDITERKQAEEKFLQAQKMEAVGQLTGGVAHDFNNLLTVIIGSLELIRDDTDGDSVRGGMIDRGVQAAERGAALTHRLLAFSRKQTLMPASLDLNMLISGMTDMLGRTLGEPVEIRSTGAEDLWLCQADPSQIENALLNLAINARDAMPGGGILTIETANVFLDDIFAARQADVEPGQYVMLGVSDSGGGIAPDMLERVFEPFFTTKDVGKGSGLGLSMVYGFAKQSGGNVTIYSEPGRGTTVKLYLPRSGAESDALDLSKAASDIPLARGERILVVEDDPEVRVLAVALLADLGYEIVEADTAEAALDVMAHTDAIDLLLTDVVLPGDLNGPELAAEVRQRTPAIKIIFMTGYAEDAFKNYSATEEQMNLIQKPFGKASLASMVRGVLDR